jgi:plasmid stabilization system protein ParE
VKLVYSQDAVTDLARLRDFIATSDPTAATRIAADLIARINGLCAFPEMGRSVPEAPEPESVRDFVFGKYVVRYTVHGSALVILRIWHHYESSRGGT